MFNNLKISIKLIVGFVSVAVIAGLIGVIGIRNIGIISDADVLLYEHMTRPAASAGELSTYFQRARSNVLEMIALRDADHIRKIAPKIEDRLATVEKCAADFEKTIQDRETREAFEAFKKSHSVYLMSLHKMMDLALAGKNAEALALWFGEADKERGVEQEAIEKLVALKVTQAKETSDHNTDLAGSSKTTMLVTLAAGMLVAIGLGQLIARTMSKSMKSLVGQAHTLANGDLTLDIQQNSKDEFGQLAGAFREMVENLRSIVGNVREASAAVASASSEISASTEEMSAGAQEQSSQTAEVAGAVEEMARTIVDNSRNAVDTAETAKQAKVAAEEGGRVVEETVGGLKRMADVVKQSAQTVQALGKSSDQIGKIISVIDDIADQTNLLALNAAIEAARAGEQGRGFAVVADEVRKLAERTTKATKEIASMIRRIQTDTGDAVSSMEEGTKQVDEGIRLADRAGVSLHEIVGISQKVTDMVALIATASEQQSSASEQISKNIEAISSVTCETATGVQQIARAAEDLNRLTENLQILLDKFKLPDDAGHSSFSPVTRQSERNARSSPISVCSVREDGVLTSRG